MHAAIATQVTKNVNDDVQSSGLSHRQMGLDSLPSLVLKGEGEGWGVVLPTIVRPLFELLNELEAAVMPAACILRIHEDFRTAVKGVREQEGVA